MSGASKAIGPVETARTMDSVIVVDEFSVRHHGIVTSGFGSDFPAVNVVFVTQDIRKRDGYGRQKEHLCSCSHAARQDPSCPGRYWYKDVAYARPTERDSFAIQLRAEQCEQDREAAFRELRNAAEAAGRSGVSQEDAKAHDKKWSEALNAILS